MAMMFLGTDILKPATAKATCRGRTNARAVAGEGDTTPGTCESTMTAKGKCSHGTGRADAKSTQSGPGQQSKGAEKMIVTETERDGSPALESALQDV